MISLNSDSHGNIQTSGIVKILDFAMHEMIALIVKLSYRVQIRDNYAGDRMQDFVIGQAIHMPHITKEGNLANVETQFDLGMGPGTTLTGEMLWDYSQVRPPNGPKLFVKVATILSLSETLQIRGADKMAEDEKVGDAALENLRNTVAEEHKE